MTGRCDERLYDEEALRGMYEGEGMTQREIADRLGCHVTTVSKWMRRLGIEARWPSHPTRDKQDELRRMYLEEKLSKREIADRVGVSASTVQRWLELHDIPRRGYSEAGRLKFERGEA